MSNKVKEEDKYTSTVKEEKEEEKEEKLNSYLLEPM